jgi:hypothetical protein
VECVRVALSATIATAAEGGTIEVLRVGANSNALVVVDTLGTDGRRLSIEPHDQATSNAAAQVQLVPGAAIDPATTIPAQILLYNQTGNDYERFTFSCVRDQYLIESTYNGAGSAKDILVQVGGSVSGAVDGVNAAVFYADASVDLQGGSFSADGKSWGATRTRVADPGNTGDSRLIIDTRTETPANNAADSSSLEYRRGGVAMWNVGLNYSGLNTDSLDFYSRTNSSPRVQVLQTGEVVVRGDAPSDYGGVLQLVNTAGHNWRIGEFDGAGTLCFRDVSTGNYPLRLGAAGGAGFWGHAAPTTQPAAPVTLADVIAILRGCGLAA